MLKNSAAILEVLFTRNGWKSFWRDGIYDYVDYHAQIHEVARDRPRPGLGTIRRSRDRVLKLKTGKVAILPAGPGHQRLDDGDDLLVVGA